MGSKGNRDGFELTVRDALGAYLGEDKNPYISLTFSEVDGQTVAVASCEPHHKAVFLEESDGSQFYVRAGNTSRLLDVKEASEYINARWGSPALAG